MDAGALVSALSLSFYGEVAESRLKESGCGRQLILQGKQCTDRKTAIPFCKRGMGFL
jgi:hypothetical protein